MDNRVHCCFYFVNPYGHGLKPLDVEVLRQLSDKVGTHTLVFWQMLRPTPRCPTYLVLGYNVLIFLAGPISSFYYMLS